MSTSDLLAAARNRASWTAFASTFERAMRIGQADVRGCGCPHDPVVFGHACPSYRPRKVTFSGANDCTRCDL